MRRQAIPMEQQLVNKKDLTEQETGNDRKG